MSDPCPSGGAGSEDAAEGAGGSASRRDALGARGLPGMFLVCLQRGFPWGDVPGEKQPPGRAKCRDPGAPSLLSPAARSAPPGRNLPKLATARVGTKRFKGGKKDLSYR